MTTTLIKQKKPNGIDDIFYTSATYEEHISQLKSQPLHRRIMEYEKLSSMLDVFLDVEDITAIDLENRIILGAFLSRVRESELYNPASFEKCCLEVMDMRLKDAQDYMKTSEFILASNVPMDDLYSLKWEHYQILALHIQPSELESWLEFASYIKPKELDGYFKKRESSDVEKFIDWYTSGNGQTTDEEKN